MRGTVFKVRVIAFCLAILSAFVNICVAAPITAEPPDEREVTRQAVLQGILGKKALLLVDGQRLMLSVGQAERSGVRVLRIGAETVEITLDGQRRQLRLGDAHSVTGRFKERESIAVTIYSDKRGMYNTIGSINGLQIY